MSARRRGMQESAPGVDPAIEFLIVWPIYTACIIIAAIFWTITAICMFVWMGCKNGFVTTAKTLWENTEPSKPKTI